MYWFFIVFQPDVCLVVVLFSHVIFMFFFFFKQKTAYELRISDWSSDVCSSDLREEILAFLHRLCGRDCAQHHGFAERREHRAVGLAGNAARFEREGLAAPLDAYSFRIEHSVSFIRRADPAGDRKSTRLNSSH